MRVLFICGAILLGMTISSSAKAVPLLAEAAALFVGKNLIEDASKKLSKNIDEARAAAEIAISKADNVAEARLKQVDAITQRSLDRLFALGDKTETAVLNIINETSHELERLRGRFFRDLENTLNSAVCKADITLNAHLSDALGDVGRLLGTNSIEITLPVKTDPSLPRDGWMSSRRSNRQVFDIQTPFDQTYVAIRDRLLANLEHLESGQPAHIVVSTHSLIASLAERTACFTKATQKTYLQEMEVFQRRARVWNEVLKVEINL